MERHTKEIYDRWLALDSKRRELRDKLYRKFMLEFNYNSNHIEGNTLTYGQTELLLLFGKVAGDANMRDLEEMKAHNVGLVMTLEEAAQADKPLTETFIRQVHQVLMREDYEVYRKLPGGQTTSYVVHAGTYKTRPNSVITRAGERFDYASPEETPALMSDLVSWYNAAAASEELDVISLAALFHYRYIRIHPFEDGNGRIARLMMNFIFCRHNYPPIVVPSKIKEAYLTALNKADLNVGPTPSDGARATIEQISPFAHYIERLVAAELERDCAIADGGADGNWWYDGEMVTLKGNAARLIELVAVNPAVTVAGMAMALGINKSAVQRHVKSMQEKGWLVRTGAPRGGEWHTTLSRL